MDGINIAGFLTAESGLGTGARNMVQALKTIGVPYALSDVTCTSSRRNDLSLREEISGEAPYDVSLFHVNPDTAKSAAKELSDAFFSSSKKIAYWVWEASVVPEHWKKLALEFDEVWTPSTYTHAILSDALPVPVRHIPHPIVTPRISDVERDTRTFLCMFDYLSVFERKNPIAAINAFLKAFPEEDDVRLIMKCINANLHPEKHRQLIDAATDHRITIINGYMRPEEVHELIASSLAMVSLHRSEGFGLHLAEAMALGTPVIATDFGGNTDFMHNGNSYGVAYDLYTLEKALKPYPKGSLWAEPSVTDAANHMRALFERRDVRIPKIASQFDPETIGLNVASTLTMQSSPLVPSLL